MKNILLVAIFLALGFSQMNGQFRLTGERGIYTQAHVNPFLVNPGATGFFDFQELLFNYRNTWATFPDSPRSYTFSYNGPLGNRLGLGAQLMSDRFGAFETTKFSGSLAYSIQSETNKVSFGLSAEYIQHSLGGDATSLVDLNDIEIITRLDGSQYFDASFGIYGWYDNKLIYGLVFPSLISSRINDTGNVTEPDRDFNYILNLGYRVNVEGYDMTIEPSILIKQLTYTPFHVDLNLKMEFLEQKLTGGVSYTLGADERFGFLVGTRINNFGFYYTYNISFHDFQQYNNGSHEFTLKFNLSTDKEFRSNL